MADIPEDFQEHWLKQNREESLRQYCHRVIEDRLENNIKPYIANSRALLAMRLSSLKEYSKFLGTWTSELSDDEKWIVEDMLGEIERILNHAAFREIPRKAVDIVTAVVAGLKEIREEDFLDISAQCVYWQVYRLSKYCVLGERTPLTAWATSFQRISFEATATGSSNQKNRISKYSLEACDRTWKQIMGTRLLVDLHKIAKDNGLDTRVCIWQISNMMGAAYKIVPDSPLSAKDYDLQHKAYT